MSTDVVSASWVFRVSFELEPGAVGQMTDFKESNKKLEWNLKKAIFLLNALNEIQSLYVPILSQWSFCSLYGFK